MNRIVEKKRIKDYISENRNTNKSEVICELSEKFNISLEESLDSYNSYIKREELIKNSVLDEYAKNARSLKTNEFGVPIVKEW